jgi:hypothetical protein
VVLRPISNAKPRPTVGSPQIVPENLVCLDRAFRHVVNAQPSQMQARRGPVDAPSRAHHPPPEITHQRADVARANGLSFNRSRFEALLGPRAGEMEVAGLFPSVFLPSGPFRFREWSLLDFSTSHPELKESSNI